MGARVEKTRGGGRYSEAGFWGFVRSTLRRASRRWGPIYDTLHAARRAYEGPARKNQRWEYLCAQCRGWFPMKQVSVDHITPCGSLRSEGDLPGFVRRLFCEPDGLQVLCNDCHAAKTAADKERQDVV